jgi:predicted DNA-binding transcriptional regulator YafY
LDETLAKTLDSLWIEDPVSHGPLHIFPLWGGTLVKQDLSLLEECEDGSADYVLYYTDPGWAARRVMRYVGEAVVLEPEELRREIHRQASALLETYGDGA